MSFILLNKSVLKISGANIDKLLDGLITQDINKATAKTPIHAMFLNNKGRVLFITIIYKDLDNNFYLEIEDEFLMDLAKHIHKHDLTKKVEFNKDDLKVAISFNDEEGFLPDPRSEKMPKRALVNGNYEENHKQIEEYNSLRLELAIAENYDFIKAKSLANDLNAELLNAVSFTKGCYLGQELTSRTKHIKQSKNQIVCLNNTVYNIKEYNCEVFSSNGDKIGITFSYNSNFVLAILKRDIDLNNLVI